MKQERVPFAPLDSDIDDGRIEQLARDKGVGTLAKPGSGEQGRSAPQAVATTVAAVVSTVVDDAGATPRSEMKTVNLELPDYAWTELKIRAVHRQTSLRHVIMTALRADGITIADIDMVEDGRRLRGNSSGS